MRLSIGLEAEHILALCEGFVIVADSECREVRRLRHLDSRSSQKPVMIKAAETQRRPRWCSSPIKFSSPCTT